MLPVTFGIHKTFLVASTLAARLGPKPVYRNAKCRGGAESSAQAKPSADVPWCREGAHAKRPNSNRIRAHAKQNAPMDSSPRQAKCPYAKLPKASNGSKLRAQGMQNTSQKKGSQKRCVRNPSTWCRNCWQRIRKGQTPLQAELGQAKNDAFATLPHGAETAASKP